MNYFCNPHHLIRLDNNTELLIGLYPVYSVPLALGRVVECISPVICVLKILTSLTIVLAFRSL